MIAQNSSFYNVYSLIYHQFWSQQSIMLTTISCMIISLLSFEIDWNRLITRLFFCDWRFQLWLIRMQRSLSRRLMRLQNNWWWIYMIIRFEHSILRRNDISSKSSSTQNSSSNLFFAWKIESKLSFTRIELRFIEVSVIIHQRVFAFKSVNFLIVNEVCFTSLWAWSQVILS